jgi:hypothetical protein
MTHRNPAAPYPEESFELLQEAIDILDGIEATKDQREEIQGVMELLDRLTNLMLNYDPGSFPADSVGRIKDARGVLNESVVDHNLIAGAQTTLKVVLRHWDDLWREPEELEGG